MASSFEHGKNPGLKKSISSLGERLTVFQEVPCSMESVCLFVCLFVTHYKMGTPSSES
jgi:hypothetical protein